MLSGYCSAGAIAISIFLCILHTIRIYNLSKGNESCIKVRFIFGINILLFLGTPIWYIIMVFKASFSEHINFSNFGFNYYFWCINMILYFTMLIYYRKVKKRKHHNDLVDELIFIPSSYDTLED